jgi:ferric-dicitrate binding protein FerR (iron transport regulator)
MKPALSVASAFLACLLIASYLFINEASNLITVQSKHGQSIEVILPDSSIVHLNSHSSISYNAALFAFNRTVDMTGEAFFDVQKKSFRKFKLNVNNVNVTVLGTRFNVNAYQSRQSIDVVLEEGNIEITLDDNPEFRRLLKPGEKAAINIQSQILTMSQVDAKDYSSWKEGILYFKNSKLSDFFNKLETRYGVRFMMEDNEILRNMNISLTIDNDQLNEVIEVIQLTLPITISSETDTLKVKLDKKRYNLIK